MDENKLKQVKATIKAGLSDYLNEKQVEFITPYFLDYPMRLKIVHVKKTYWGLCRFPKKKDERFIITLVRTGMQGHFFLVFLHEIAHMLAHISYGEKISSSHGKEWGIIVRNLISQSIKDGCFSQEETEILSASAKSYVPLTNATLNVLEQRIIKLYKPGIVLVGSLPENAVFKLKNEMEMRFVKKLRKYYECEEIHSGEKYRVNPDAEVEEWRKA